jgi:hypothetical protein
MILADDCGHALLEPGEQLLVAGDRPRVERREQELGVAGLEIVEVGELADLVSDDELKIPERLEHGVDEPLLITADAALEKNHEIDVGMQTERPAAVPAERTHHQRPGRVHARGFDQLLDDLVHPGGVAGLGLATAPPLARLERKLPPRRRQGGGQLRPAGPRIREPSRRLITRSARRLFRARIRRHQPTPHEGYPLRQRIAAGV